MFIEKLEELFDSFKLPFLPEGFVECKRVDEIYGRPSLSVRIGERDVTIMEDGEIVGSGIRMELIWDIIPTGVPY